jgi:class 3 adenylate cyclase/alpha-beta hydrolase superfamily lysophospholipase
MEPETRYAQATDGTYLAYQVVGDGPIDLVYVPTWMSHVELLWEEPAVARFFERLGSFARLILFDRRGSGLSDPIYTGGLTLEEQMDDVRAVLDAAGSERAAIFAQLEGGAMASLFAATFPDRTTALVLYTTFARTVRADDIPWADTKEERDARLEVFVENWGDGSRLLAFAPTRAGDARVKRWYGRLERFAASPGTIRKLSRAIGDTDVRAVLSTIQVPTLVVYRRDDPLINPLHSKYIAERIPGAKLVELPPGDTLPVFSDNDVLTDELEEFLTGVRRRREPDRVLATVMFTDIVDSTKQAAERGDAAWRDLLGRHDQLVREQLQQFDGREIKTIGDGFLVTFDGPARGIRCALGINDAVEELGIKIRAGLHTGEIELVGDDVSGMAVNIGARVGATAGPNEVLVSSTVKDLVVGSGIEFADRGERELKGVPGEWRLFAVER